MNEMKEISCKIFSIGCACKHRYSNGGYNKIKRPNYEKKNRKHCNSSSC